ncbi:hypothetical protein [Kutzneria sp. NPDC052558]|uniref:hypothetical protein n=1 Tax=Kutzneria sp. NPDC052558 TaxID=3364121 RepID=UPI0037C5B65A
MDQQGNQVEIYAHIDESGGRLPDGRRLYGMAAVLTEETDHPLLRKRLRALLLPGQAYLHQHDESFERRMEIVREMAELPFTGAIVVTSETTAAETERARRRLLRWLLPRLQHGERVERVVVESRAGGDKHDRRTRDHLIRSRTISSGMGVTHVTKVGDELLWLADFLVSTYTTALVHDQTEQWAILEAAHVIEVVTDPG